MRPRRSARFDGSGILQQDRPPSLDGTRPRVIASVGPSTPPLRGIDMVRLDAAAHPLHVLSSLRQRTLCPTMLDLPGPRTPRQFSLLTTSELLVFASAEPFEWVNLRDLEQPEQVDAARAVLHPSIRVAVSLPPDFHHGALAAIASLADAVVLDRRGLSRRVGAAHLREHLRCALRVVRDCGKPCVLAGGLLSSMQRDPSPTVGQLDQLWQHMEDGCGGFLLMEETLTGAHPQACVDVLRLMAASAPRPGPRARAGARLSGVPSLAAPLRPVHPEPR